MRPKTDRRRPGPARDPAGAARFLDAGARHAAAGRLAEAASAYERAEAADPQDFRAAFSLATIDLQLGRPSQALPRLRRAAALQPDLFDAQHNLGAVSQTLQLWDGAATAYQAALELRPDAQETRRNLAIVLTILGRTDEALGHHRRLAGDAAMRPWALTRIALLRPAAIGDGDLDELRRAAGDPHTDQAARAGFQFAIGEVLERRGEDAAAFSAFSAGNRLKRESFAAAGLEPRTLIDAHAVAARAVMAHFTAGRLRRADQGLATAAPIFIVGMPRSGSTLLEQILASVPGVIALGETAALPRLLEGGFAADKVETRAIARRYLEAMRGLGWPAVGRFVDKTLENYLHIGAIAAMFPKAVILHAVRDPVDTCLSCYRQLFASGSETLYDLADIGAEYVTYRRVMAHWREVLPGRIVDVDYEVLVADPERRTRWLVTEACGLAWNDAALRFHEAAGPVRTASSGQVRQPIFTTSVARWRRYEAELAPLFAALGPYGPQR
jgi:tetratricopeptide (TPR) repeat protein